jgi:hypothetical protein
MAVWLQVKAWNLTFLDKAIKEDMRKTLCNDMDEATIQQVLTGGDRPKPPAIFYEQVSRVHMLAEPAVRHSVGFAES